MNFIGIDISLNSTAIFIENEHIMKIISVTNKNDNNIYIKELDRYGVIFHHHNREISKNYSKNEILKLKHYNMLSNLIVNDIKKFINMNEKTYCQIEGYSFSKNT